MSPLVKNCHSFFPSPYLPPHLPLGWSWQTMDVPAHDTELYFQSLRRIERVTSVWTRSWSTRPIHDLWLASTRGWNSRSRRPTSQYPGSVACGSHQLPVAARSLFVTAWWPEGFQVDRGLPQFLRFTQTWWSAFLCLRSCWWWCFHLKKEILHRFRRVFRNIYIYWSTNVIQTTIQWNISLNILCDIYGGSFSQHDESIPFLPPLLMTLLVFLNSDYRF